MNKLKKIESMMMHGLANRKVKV